MVLKSCCANTMMLLGRDHFALWKAIMPAVVVRWPTILGIGCRAGNGGPGDPLRMPVPPYRARIPIYVAPTQSSIKRDNLCMAVEELAALAPTCHLGSPPAARDPTVRLGVRFGPTFSFIFGSKSLQIVPFWPLSNEYSFSRVPRDPREMAERTQSDGSRRQKINSHGINNF